MVDISAERKKIKAAAGSQVLSDMGKHVEVQSKVALAGAVLGFVYAISQRKPWFLYTLGGLLGGCAVGYGIDWAKKETE